MKRLYILGNGFDLYMGMKTSYNNFFEEKGYSLIRKKLSEKLNKEKKDFLISILFKKTGQFNKEISNPIQELEDLEKSIFKMIKGVGNLFLLYLIIFNDELVDWKDVENQIKPYIEYTKKVLSNMQKSAEEITYENLENNKKNNELELFIFRRFVDKKIDVSIKNIELKELNKFEKEFGQYIKNLDNPLQVNSFDTVTEKIENVFNNLQDD